MAIPSISDRSSSCCSDGSRSIRASDCATQAEIDEKVAQARREGVLRREPEQLGDPVGYFAFFADPDGNTLELSWGQRVGLEVILAGKPGE